MAETRSELKYSKSHQWARLEDDGLISVGISDFAQAALGDVVFTQLPEVGQEFRAGDEIGVVESVKTASDIFVPVSGEVMAINDKLEDNPELINEAPYDEGWLFRVSPLDEQELEELLGAEEYQEFCEKEA